MRKQDIKVGDHLSWKPSSYSSPREAVVLRTGAEQPRGRGYYGRAAFVGTEVKIGEMVKIVPNRELVQTWAAQVAEDTAEAERKAQFAADKKAAFQNRLLRAKDAHDALVAAGFPTVTVRVYDRVAHAFRDAGFEVSTLKDIYGGYSIETPLPTLTDYVEYGKNLSLNAFTVVEKLEEDAR